MALCGMYLGLINFTQSMREPAFGVSRRGGSGLAERSLSVVVRGQRRALVIDEEVRVQRRYDHPERTRHLLKIEEALQIAVAALVCETERALREDGSGPMGEQGAVQLAWLPRLTLRLCSRLSSSAEYADWNDAISFGFSDLVSARSACPA